MQFSGPFSLEISSRMPTSPWRGSVAKPCNVTTPAAIRSKTDPGSLHVSTTARETTGQGRHGLTAGDWGTTRLLGRPNERHLSVPSALKSKFIWCPRSQREDTSPDRRSQRCRTAWHYGYSMRNSFYCKNSMSTNDNDHITLRLSSKQSVTI